MNICPHCGDDILDSASMVACSSCGQSLKPASEDHSRDDDRVSDPDVTERNTGDEPIKDDTSPIRPSDDLEVVQSGEAFWAAQAQPSEPEPADEPDDAEEADEEEPKKSFIFDEDRPRGHAPSLAELARLRKQERSEEPEDSDAADSDTPDEDETIRTKTTDPLDDTAPEGVKAKPDPVIETIPPPNVKVVSKSPDVAFIEKNRLLVPGATWSSGETVVIQGRTFQLKRKINKYPVSPQRIGIGVGSFLAGCLFVWMMSAGSGAPQSNIFGVVRDVQGGLPLPGVTVAIDEGDRTAESDPSGMFYFNGLDGGIYTLVATDPIYGSTRKEVTISGQATSVTLDLQKPREIAATAAPPKQAAKPEESSKPKETSTTSSSSSKKRGELAVTASVANAKVYIDGKMLGVGNAVYTGIRPGKRTIKVVHDGYESWQEQVTITAGKTTRIEPNLFASTPAEPVKKQPEEYAATGRKYMESRDYEAAVQQFNHAISASPRAQYYAWRADAHAGLKQLSRAEQDFLKAVALFKKQNEDSRLDDMLSRAVLVVPGSPNLRMAYADYLFSHRKLHDAEKSYRKALELGGDRVKAYTGIGLSQYAGGSFDDAANSWSEADVASGEVDPHIAGYLALVNARLQHRASCRNAVRRLEQFPDVLAQFRSHPDWSRVQRLTGEG